MSLQTTPVSTKLRFAPARGAKDGASNSSRMRRFKMDRFLDARNSHRLQASATQQTCCSSGSPDDPWAVTVERLDSRALPPIEIAGFTLYGLAFLDV